MSTSARMLDAIRALRREGMRLYGLDADEHGMHDLGAMPDAMRSLVRNCDRYEFEVTRIERERPGTIEAIPVGGPDARRLVRLALQYAQSAIRAYLHAYRGADYAREKLGAFDAARTDVETVLRRIDTVEQIATEHEEPRLTTPTGRFVRPPRLQQLPYVKRAEMPA